MEGAARELAREPCVGVAKREVYACTGHNLSAMQERDRAQIAHIALSVPPAYVPPLTPTQPQTKPHAHDSG